MTRKARRALNRESSLSTNQQNAQHSTGPKTPEGKVASSQNSFRHGLSAAKLTMIDGENIQDFLDLANGLLAEHKPATITEDALVTKMAESLWWSARAANLQQRLLEQNSPDRQLFALFLRYQIQHDRAFSRALNNFIKLRQSREKEARQRETGFVSQNQKQELHEAKIRNFHARSEAHESGTQLRKLRLAVLTVTAAAQSGALPTPPHAQPTAETL